MAFLVDTNVLVRLADPDDQHHRLAADAMKVLKVKNQLLVLVPQAIREFWVVATRPLAQNGLGMRPSEAQEHLRALVRLLNFKPDTPRVHERWIELVVERAILGKSAHTTQRWWPLLRLTASMAS